MTKNQFLLTSLIPAIPAGGLMAAVALGILGGLAGGVATMWGLLASAFVLGLVTLAMPVVVFLLIPADPSAANAAPPESTDSASEAAPADAGATDDEVDEDGEDFADDGEAFEDPVASADEDFDDFDDDGDFQSDDEFTDFEDELVDDFDDDEDFV